MGRFQQNYTLGISINSGFYFSVPTSDTGH
jgi:hypothetical protein